MACPERVIIRNVNVGQLNTPAHLQRVYMPTFTFELLFEDGKNPLTRPGMALNSAQPPLVSDGAVPGD